MKATVMYGAGDVRVEDVPDPVVQKPTEALIRVTYACVCGSDLHPYHDLGDTPEGRRMGHEAIGVVEEIGDDVRTLSVGDTVIVPFAWSDGTCPFCRDGITTSCVHGGFFDGAPSATQAEKLIVPEADGTAVKVPAGTDEALMPSLLTLSDVYLTGYHAAVQGQVGPGKTVTVIGDGAVGLSAVLASKQLGAETIILMGRHTARTDLGREFGATHVVAERGDEGVAKVMEITGGEGSHVVLEAVGHMPAYEQAYGIVRPGGTISRVGVPQYEEAPVGFTSLFGKNATLTGGPATVRAYLEAAIPQVLDGTIDPGRVFDRELPLSEIAEGYRLMDSREALKVLIRP
ncbi:MULTISPECIES: zinc-binding dehydrogenase [unclassified Frigoribacterium]|jgi:threonine dehydrogenase-like Zn-dependent dehydrogenase|nr:MULTISPECIES: alcohol dehydrogenase catalytic domain-containing protein [unclassified Frigoribacterium]MBD8537683.1 alcohol dehydrogenase catalytic domain-containing protein [Frigoribacterium sp. CFBP 8751]ROS52444.1 threonine dehydrogenase-like Zn-dependent dehydrogenase [Frigoribacterium sp. PhB118]WAC52185.1 alcohol dehydrogenase catalytic domain-containing protein [Frigoribacterium sp. SL97]